MIVEVSPFERVKYKIYAGVLLAGMAGFLVLCMASYARVFTPTVPVYLHADRTGLQMTEGNRVLFRGVSVGEVGAVRPATAGDGVEITLRLNPKIIQSIPANVHVSLDQLTPFGAKTVSLKEPADPAQASLRPATTLGVGRVTVEVNSIFKDLNRVLADAQPGKVDAVLGGLAQALDGRGEKIGSLTEDLDAYLQRFNTNMPVLRQDFAKGAEVADIYADATPSLMRLLANATVTGNTIVEKRDDLDKALVQVRRTSGIGTDFLAVNGDKIVDLSHDLLPTTGLLRKYSPEYACVLQGLDNANKQLETAWSDNGRFPGVSGLISFGYGNDPYRNPQDRPNMNLALGPDCVGLPQLDGEHVPPQLERNFARGDASFGVGDNRPRVGSPPVVAQLFGAKAVNPRNGYEERRDGSGSGEGGGR